MIKKFSINDITDEIHHPYLTKYYRILLITTVLSIVLFSLLDNAPSIHESYGSLFYNLSTYLYIILFIDYLLRVIGSIKHLDMENNDEFIHYNSLFSYLFSYFGLIDFIATIPFYMFLFNINNTDLLTIISISTLLKIARFSPALLVLKDVIVSERKSLLAAFYLMMILTFSISTMLYFVERDANPEGFPTLLNSIWWAIVTLATVGYGDVVPITALGKLLGAIASISGLGMFALPAGILASGFAQEMKRLRNITNWNMVSSVPIFSNLEFGVIADITKLLHIKRFSKNELIIKEGSKGNAMYFIVEGSVLVHKKGLKVTLKKGEFFGEIALLKNIPRTANVTSKSKCELLELTTYDFQNFIRTKDDILKKIEKVARTRYEEY